MTLAHREAPSFHDFAFLPRSLTECELLNFPTPPDFSSYGSCCLSWSDNQRGLSIELRVVFEPAPFRFLSSLFWLL